MQPETLAALGALRKDQIVRVGKAIGASLGDYERKSKDAVIGIVAASASHDSIVAAIRAMGEPLTIDGDFVNVTKQAPAALSAPKAKPVSGDALVDAIRAIAGTAAQSVDEATVRAIVAGELEKVGPRIVEKTIIVRDAVKVALPEGEHVRKELQHVVDLLSQGCNVLLVGPAGSGKSHFAEQVARALGLPFSSNSCSAGMSESALSGWLLPIKDGGTFAFVPASFVNAYENGGVHLIDEIDAADPNTLVYINQALANGGFFLPQRHDNPHVKRHADFRCIAAANTYGNGGDRMYVGREQLDASTLDRFWMVDFDYDKALEEKLVDDAVLSWGRELREKAASLKLRRVVSTRKLAEASRLMRAGMKFDAVKQSFFAPWTADECAKVGYMRAA